MSACGDTATSGAVPPPCLSQPRAPAPWMVHAETRCFLSPITKMKKHLLPRDALQGHGENFCTWPQPATRWYHPSPKVAAPDCSQVAALPSLLSWESFAITSALLIIRSPPLIFWLVYFWLVYIYLFFCVCAKAIILASKAVLPHCDGPPPPGVFIQTNRILY